MKGILLSFVLLTISSPLLAQDHPEIRKLLAEYSRTWNTHEAASVIRFYAEDADVLSGGNLIRGRDAIEKTLSSEFAAVPKDAVLTLDVKAVRSLNPDYSMVDGAYRVGTHHLDSHNGEGSAGNFSMLVRHTDQRWTIVAFRLLNDPRALCLASSEALAPSARGTVPPEVTREVRGLGSAFTSDEKATIVRNLLESPKVAQRFRDHRTRALQVVEDGYPDEEKTPGGPTRRLASVVIFDYTAGETWRFAYDPEKSELVRERAIKGQPTPSQEERDEATRILRAESRLEPLLREGAVIEGGFTDSAPPGGNARDRYLQFLLLTKDRKDLMRFVVVDLTTQKVAAVLSSDRKPEKEKYAEEHKD